MLSDKKFTEEQLKTLQKMKSDIVYPEIVKVYGELCDSDLLALSTMLEVQIGLADFRDKIEASEIKKIIDNIDE